MYKSCASVVTPSCAVAPLCVSRSCISPCVTEADGSVGIDCAMVDDNNHVHALCTNETSDAGVWFVHVMRAWPPGIETLVRAYCWMASSSDHAPPDSKIAPTPKWPRWGAGAHLRCMVGSLIEQRALPCLRWLLQLSHAPSRTHAQQMLARLMPYAVTYGRVDALCVSCVYDAYDYSHENFSRALAAACLHRCDKGARFLMDVMRARAQVDDVRDVSKTALAAFALLLKRGGDFDALRCLHLAWHIPQQLSASAIDTAASPRLDSKSETNTFELGAVTQPAAATPAHKSPTHRSKDDATHEYGAVDAKEDTSHGLYSCPGHTPCIAAWVWRVIPIPIPPRSLASAASTSLTVQPQDPRDVNRTPEEHVSARLMQTRICLRDLCGFRSTVEQRCMSQIIDTVFARGCVATFEALRVGWRLPLVSLVFDWRPCLSRPGKYSKSFDVTNFIRLHQSRMDLLVTHECTALMEHLATGCGGRDGGEFMRDVWPLTSRRQELFRLDRAIIYGRTHASPVVHSTRYGPTLMVLDKLGYCDEARLCRRTENM